MSRAERIKPISAPNLQIGAEIVPGVTPLWYLLRVQPGQENIAGAHLAGRRFGIYCPLEDIFAVGSKQDQPIRQKPMFPGYVFIFLWGLAHHIVRVRACPGVSGFLTDGQGNPVVVPDQVIKQIQKIEWEQYISHLPRGLFRRRRQREERVIQPWKHPNHGFSDPDPNARITALHQALGLQS